MSENLAFCVKCDDYVSYTTEERWGVVGLNTRLVGYQKIIDICDNCGEFVQVPEHTKENSKRWQQQLKEDLKQE